MEPAPNARASTILLSSRVLEWIILISQLKNTLIIFRPKHRIVSAVSKYVMIKLKLRTEINRIKQQSRLEKKLKSLGDILTAS